jgi:hypothetical protein
MMTWPPILMCGYMSRFLVVKNSMLYDVCLSIINDSCILAEVLDTFLESCLLLLSLLILGLGHYMPALQYSGWICCTVFAFSLLYWSSWTGLVLIHDELVRDNTLYYFLDTIYITCIFLCLHIPSSICCACSTYTNIKSWTGSSLGLDYIACII